MIGCPLLIVWLGLTPPPAGYDVFVDGLKATTTAPGHVHAELCITELGNHEIYVVAFDAEGKRSQPSRSLTVNITKATADPCADLDKDGNVGWSDYGILARQFGGSCE